MRRGPLAVSRSLACLLCLCTGATGGCDKKRRHRAAGSRGVVSHVQPVSATQAAVVRTLRQGRRRRVTVSLEDLERGVRWTYPSHPVISSTVGDGILTLRYHEPGIEAPEVAYGVVARAVTDGRVLWRFRAKKPLDANLFAARLSTRVGDLVLERFEDAQDQTVVFALDARTGKVRWRHLIEGRLTDPRVLGFTAKHVVLAVPHSRTTPALWMVLRLADGKRVWRQPYQRSEALGGCLHQGRFWHLREDGLHALDLRGPEPVDRLVNAHFFGPQFGGGPREALTCGTYGGQLVMAMTVQRKFIGPKHHAVVGLTPKGTVAWQIDLGSWRPRIELARSVPAHRPLYGALPRFVFFVAEDQARPFLELRMMVVDLKTRRVVAKGPERKTLLNWQCVGRMDGRFYFQRFDQYAAFDGRRGRLVAGLRCPGKGWPGLATGFGRVWTCGRDEQQGRWSLRDGRTFAPIPGRHNFTSTEDRTTALTKFFGITP